MEKRDGAGQATDNNMAHAHYMLDDRGYKCTPRISNTLLFEGNNSYTNAPRCYIIRTLLVVKELEVESLAKKNPRYKVFLENPKETVNLRKRHHWTRCSNRSVRTALPHLRVIIIMIIIIFIITTSSSSGNTAQTNFSLGPSSWLLVCPSVISLTYVSSASWNTFTLQTGNGVAFILNKFCCFLRP